MSLLSSLNVQLLKKINPLYNDYIYIYMMLKFSVQPFSFSVKCHNDDRMRIPALFHQEVIDFLCL